ncbi:MAG: hypothetical protein ACP5E3_08000 [Bacteroidales bacterium]
MKKQILSIFFLLILIAPAVSVYILFQQKIVLLREEVKERILTGLDREELILLKFSREQSEDLLKWEHSKEFEYEGEMYDIVEISVEDDTIHYLCWKDHEETRLKKELADLTAKAMEQNTRNDKSFDSLSRLLSSLFFQDKKLSMLVDVRNCLIAPGDYTDNYDSIIFAPPTPPPQSC